MYLHQRIPLSYFLFLVFYFSASLLFSQERLRGNPDELLKLSKYEGYAEYYFQITGRDTLLNGPFFMQSAALNNLLETEKHYFSISGSFASGKLDSTWNFQFGDFDAAAGTELIDLHYKVKLNGIKHTATANFEEGKPHGGWNHSVNEIDSSEIKRVLFQSYAHFVEGIPQERIRLENDSLTMLGRFLRNGHAHDIWVLNFNQALQKMEQWHFLDGRLEKMVIQNGSVSDTIFLYKNKIEHGQFINLDQNYLKILSLQNRYDSTVYASKGGRMADLLKDNAYYYQRIGSIVKDLDRLGGNATRPEFLVKVAHYPLEKEELQHLDDIKTLLQKIGTISQSLTDNTRLNILKHSDKNVRFLMAALDEINRDYLYPVKIIMRYHHDDLLEYLPRTDIIDRFAIVGKALTDITVQYQDSSGTRSRMYAGPETEIFSENKTGIAILTDLSEYALACILAIESELNKRLKNESIQKELEDLEKDLLAEEERLIYLVDSLNKDLPDRLNASLQSLKKTAIAELGEYSSSKNSVSKTQQVTELIDCINNFQDLAIVLSRLPARWDEIKQLYTEQVWNPFTATVMSDQLKERLTTAYDKILVAYILDRIEKDLTCSSAKNFAATLDVLYEKMQQFRKKNTSKLERKLRREDDPQVVMQLFEISI